MRVHFSPIITMGMPGSRVLEGETGSEGERREKGGGRRNREGKGRERGGREGGGGMVRGRR